MTAVIMSVSGLTAGDSGVKRTLETDETNRSWCLERYAKNYTIEFIIKIYHFTHILATSNDGHEGPYHYCLNYRLFYAIIMGSDFYGNEKTKKHNISNFKHPSVKVGTGANKWSISQKI